MFDTLKAKLYFPIAWYFRFFAEIRLRRWNPRIVVVTGSNGKTTLLHMLEAQLGEAAKVSHHANSSYGIPFDVLDLHRKTLRSSEWLNLFLQAPLNAFKKPPKEKIYIVEADTDRPGEGKFLSEFLKPEVTLWVSVGSTHGMNFDHLVKSPQPPLRKGGDVALPPLFKGGRTEGSPPASATKTGVEGPQAGGFNTVQEAIAYDFGYFLENCTKFAVINGDLPLEVKQVARTKAEVKVIKKNEDLDGYSLDKENTTFTLNGKKYSFGALLPEELFYSLLMCQSTVNYLQLTFDETFKHFELPPGRGTILRGIKQTSLIDSSYNANLASMKAVLGMFVKMPVKKKWVVLSDMLELGESEQEEHEKLAEVLSGMKLERIVLVGKRVGKYTLPKLLKSPQPPLNKGGDATLPPLVKGELEERGIFLFEKQKDALEYLKANIEGGEVILFKGSQSLFLEGIIEALLEDKKDESKLPRRGEFWEEKRRGVGL